MDSQFKLEETNDSKQQETYYSKIADRINLQSIGYHIKDGIDFMKTDKTSFPEREENAERELDAHLHRLLDDETIEKLLPEIWKYIEKKEEIQFSLGMKAGAKLALLLTTDFEHDY